MMLNTGNRNRVVLLGPKGGRTVRSLRVQAKKLGPSRIRHHPSFARRMLHHAK